MIYPRLNRVRNGQRLSVELVNGLIKRTEYAADLLRQYKCVAGTDISVIQEYDGTTISGEGAAKFNIVGRATVGGIFRGFLYNGSTFTDIIYPGATGTQAFGIDGSNIVGEATVGAISRGFLYNGSTFTDIVYPSATSTLPFDIG